MFSLIAQTEVNWLPVWLAQVWRLGIFIAASWLVGRIFWGLTNHNSDMRTLPDERKLAWIAVLVFTLHALIIILENFDNKLFYENTPLVTIALIIAIISAKKVKRAE